MEYEFKVGDKVIGNAKADIYCITKPGTVWIIEDLWPDTKHIQIRSTENYHERYAVLRQCFDLYNDESETESAAESAASWLKIINT